MYKVKTIIDSFSDCHKGIAAHRDIEKSSYLDSIVDVVMHGCNLDYQITGQPITSTI